ncbi:hypothetical protein G7Y79_00061g093070 [Physcia stellaris]|nr:hypothetical protein G7Y79_00061g093070 [Physcia stellaris]
MIDGDSSTVRHTDRQVEPLSLHEALASVFDASELEGALRIRSASTRMSVPKKDAFSTVIFAAHYRQGRVPTGSDYCSEGTDPSCANGEPEESLNDEHEDVFLKTTTSRSSMGERGRHFPLRSRKRCYICCFVLKDPHHLYPSLCKPCGAFNVAESKLSLPSSLDLKGKTAVVTGGRINLGFHTALRLLRCGASVIVTSRYPQDTARRYCEQHDWDFWRHRLRVVGADFRTAVDVFRLVTAIKAILKSWANDGGPCNLNVLVNNAAQTLTDPVAAEKKAIANEKSLKHSGSGTLICDIDYSPRVRGGTTAPWGLLEASAGNVDNRSPVNSYTSQKTDATSFPDKQTDTPGDLTMSTGPSSWVQSLTEIPYEDFITAYSVNSLVPMILTRELMPLMLRKTDPAAEQTSPPSPTFSSVPAGYILNISSREGIFERTPSSSAKNGKHVHTNMSKAALNSITQTEAATAWKKHKISINSVDPGFMSAAPEMRSVVGECPIGFEDGAGRVLWPVAMGEKGEAVWGRFLKHFGKIDVDIGLGQ